MHSLQHLKWISTLLCKLRISKLGKTCSYSCSFTWKLRYLAKGLLNPIDIITLNLNILRGNRFSSYDFICFWILCCLFIYTRRSKINFLLNSIHNTFALKKSIVVFMDYLYLLNKSIYVFPEAFMWKDHFAISLSELSVLASVTVIVFLTILKPLTWTVEAPINCPRDKYSHRENKWRSRANNPQRIAWQRLRIFTDFHWIKLCV